MDQPTRAAVDWLLGSDEPAIRMLARRDLLDEPAEDDAGQILTGPKVSALLAGQQPDGGFGNHWYRKWTGAHWRLVSLVEWLRPRYPPYWHYSGPNEMVTLNALRVLRAAGRVLTGDPPPPHPPPTP